MTDSDAIKIDWKKSLEIFENKKVMNILVILLLLVLLIWGASIRTQNIPLLKDQTTGEYIPLALDPFYFLRIAETMLKGPLPEFDPLRKPMEVGWIKEILPQTLVGMHKIWNVFGDYSIQYIDVIYPVAFFILGLIVFYLLSYVLTKSKSASLIASAFLAFIPPYLYRTTAGFADHEAIGMFSFFLALLVLTIAVEAFEKGRKINNWKKYGLPVLSGFATALTVMSWGGIGKFLFAMIPLAYAIIWLIESRDYTQKEKLKNILISYSIWFVTTFLFIALMGMDIILALKRNAFNFTGLATPLLLVFLIVDYLMVKKEHKLPKIIKNYRIISSAIAALILGIIIFQIFIGNFFGTVNALLERLVNPFGTERVALTVAENKQPYLNEWMAQIGKTFFWIFFAGAMFFGFDVARKIKGIKYQTIFSASWILFIAGILFSRISETSILNGGNFISKLFYFGAAFVFVASLIYIYIKTDMKLKYSMIVLFVWLVPMLIATRGAIRLFFVIVPTTCFMVGYLIYSLAGFAKRNKDETVKFFTLVAIIAVGVLLLLTFIGFVKTTSAQAKYTGPSANVQWQKAMAWTRENTTEGSIFAHWWDYGYWVEYLGERPTIADGGHFEGGYRDHLIGRYLLTTPEPATALSFMKTNDVSYLLIDPTDIGKYPAYSKIGSDEEGDDRYSWIQPLIIDPTQTQETNNGTIRLYRGGITLDEDIILEENGTQIFLPERQAGIGAIIIQTTTDENGETKVKQPEGIYVYNGKQYRLPIRYLEFNGNYNDFGSGVGATIKLIPYVSTSGSSLQIDTIGAAIYLSPKVSVSLFAQLYLMDDPKDLYPTVTLAHSEVDPVVEQLNAQGANIKEFAFYQGIRGPIKIWKVDYPEDIITKEEFLRISGSYSEFDNLTFTA